MQILKAANSVLSDKKYFFIFIALSVAIFWALLFASIETTSPVFLSVVSILTALIVAMQFFSFQRTGRLRVANSALSGAGLVSAFLAAIFSSAVCGVCVAAVFGFLGAGGVIFLVDNRTYVIIGSLVLLTLSLHLSSKRVNTDCGCAV